MYFKTKVRRQSGQQTGLSNFWQIARRELMGSEPVQLLRLRHGLARKRALALRKAKPATGFAAGSEV